MFSVTQPNWKLRVGQSEFFFSECTDKKNWVLKRVIVRSVRLRVQTHEPAGCCGGRIQYEIGSTKFTSQLQV